jgi:F-type H+-transporting ATPase subunit b
MEGGNVLLSPQTGTIIWTLITFGALLVLLRVVAWKPVLGLLEEREKTIKDSLDSARKAREEGEKHLAESREAMKKARQEMASVIDKGQKEAGRLRQEMLDKAQKDAEETRKRGLEEIDREKRAAVAEIRKSAADLAMAAASRLVSASMDEGTQRKLVSEFLTDIEEGTPR